MNKPAPCPFCGSTKIGATRPPNANERQPIAAICMNCHARGPLSRTGPFAKAMCKWEQRDTKKRDAHEGRPANPTTAGGTVSDIPFCSKVGWEQDVNRIYSTSKFELAVLIALIIFFVGIFILTMFQ